MKNRFFQFRPIQLVRALAYTGYGILLICFVSSFMPAAMPGSIRPDLILCATLSLSFFESERVAAIFGMLAGFALEAVGSVGFSILPLFYMLCGCVCSMLFSRVLQKNFGAYMLYMSVFMLLRSAISVIYIQFSQSDYSLDIAFTQVLMPEYAFSLIAAPVIFLLTLAVSRLLHLQKDTDAVKM